MFNYAVSGFNEQARPADRNKNWDMHKNSRKCPKPIIARLMRKSTENDEIYY
jgi:hypothetical protein